MNNYKERLKDEVRKLEKFKVEGTVFHFLKSDAVILYNVLELIDQLEEPEITEAQAWETLAPRFSTTAKELERQVVDGFMAMTMEEIEMESDKIKKLADGIKKLHAENEELKAKLDEPAKVVVPQFVADWISQAKKWGYSISTSMGHATFYGDTTQCDKAMYWAENNQDVFARAWLDGYEVEKEKLYYIVDEKGQLLLFRSQERGILRSNGADLESVLMVYEQKPSNMYQLTEKEIKDCDTRYWAFAVPVEASP